MDNQEQGEDEEQMGDDDDWLNKYYACYIIKCIYLKNIFYNKSTKMSLKVKFN
jgi:hypothetical protein